MLQAMALTTTVRSYTTGTPGRCLNQARHHHFVIDGSSHGGGPAEEVTPGEAFLAGISGCGVLLVESNARRDGLPLRRAEAIIESSRNEADTSTFTSIAIHFRLAGVDEPTARDLVDRYRAA
jgi:uncharacterized OsmC-like protein